MSSEELYIKVKKPLVSQEVAEYIENTKGQDALNVAIEVELATTDGNSVGVNQEVADFISNCYEEFIVARNYGYRVA